MRSISQRIPASLFIELRWEVIQPAEEGKLEVSYRWFRTVKDAEDWCMRKGFGVVLDVKCNSSSSCTMVIGLISYLSLESSQRAKPWPSRNLQLGTLGLGYCLSSKKVAVWLEWAVIEWYWVDSESAHCIKVWFYNTDFIINIISQFFTILHSGRRGRRFKSSHLDQSWSNHLDQNLLNKLI